jgi:hypothetical protein
MTPREREKNPPFPSLKYLPEKTTKDEGRMEGGGGGGTNTEGADSLLIAVLSASPGDVIVSWQWNEAVVFTLSDDSAVRRPETVTITHWTREEFQYAERMITQVTLHTKKLKNVKMQKER